MGFNSIKRKKKVFVIFKKSKSFINKSNYKTIVLNIAAIVAVFILAAIVQLILF